MAKSKLAKAVSNVHC